MLNIMKNVYKISKREFPTLAFMIIVSPALAIFSPPVGIFLAKNLPTNNFFLIICITL